MNTRRIKLILMLSIVALTTFASVAFADYRIVWSTIDGGGGQSSSGPYTLTGVIGQSESGSSSGDSYQILGGFLAGDPLCLVDFDDFARFALYWTQSGTGLPADLYLDDTVNADDLINFANWWLCICPQDWPLK